MIEAVNLIKTYTTKNSEVQALRGVSFDLPDKGFIFLLGKSGCGKSTLLNIIGGLDKPTSGYVNINGRSLYDYSNKQLDDYRNRHIGFIFQEFNLIDEYNVYDNIAIALNLRGEKDVTNKVSGALRSVGLGGYEKRKTSELSGGEKQRIAIARTIVSDTDIILADEPTGNLDSSNSKDIFDILKKLSEDKLVIAVTHDRENASKYADRIITLSDGMVEGAAAVPSSDVGLPADEADSSSNCKDNNGSLPNSNAKASIKNGKSGKKHDRYSRPIDGAKEKGINIACLTKLSFINIWKKIIRLIVTIILFFFMLSLFGVSVSAMRYDKLEVALETFYSSEIKEFKASAFYEDRIENYHVFKDGKIAALENDFPEYRFNKIMYNGSGNIIDLPDISNRYRIDNITEINDTVMTQYGFTKEWGAMPKAYNEVCISKFIADAVIEQNIFQEVNSYDDFKDFALPLSTYTDIEFKISGVIDTKFDDVSEKLQGIKEDFKDYPITMELKGSFTASLMVSNDFLKSIFYNNTDAVIEYSYYRYHPVLPPDMYPPMLYESSAGVRQESYGKLLNEKYGEIVYASGKSSLASDEIIISLDLMKHKAREMFPDNGMGHSGIEPGIGEEQIMAYLNSGIGYLNNAVFPIGEIAGDYKIAGFYRGNADDVLVNDDIIRRANPYAGIMAVNTTPSGNKQQDMRLMAEFFKGPYAINSYCMPDIEKANENTDIFRLFGLYSSLAFGAFAMLMMANFIVTSINVNKKQIGVLRALGMRTGGVVYIFLFEALTVGLLAFIVGVIAVFPIAALLSSFVVPYVVPIRILAISAVEIAVMFALSIATVIISSIIPIIKKSRAQIVKLLK